MGEGKKTVGELARNLQLNEDKILHSPNEQMKEQLSDYEKNVLECLQENKLKINMNFYIVVLTKKEKLMKNVIRNYFYARISCPTPNYDQVVYSYIKKDDDIKLLWVIPSRDACKHLKANATRTVPSQWELLTNVLKFADGTFYKLAKELNGEKTNTLELKDSKWKKKL